MVLCNCIAYPLICKSHAIHSYCRKRWTSDIVHWRAHAIFCHWFILVNFHFPSVFFRWPTSPQRKKLRFSLLFLVDFLDPLGLFVIVLIATNWYFMVDACAKIALDCATVFDVCICFSIIHSFSSRLFVFRLLSSSNSQTLLNFWYLGPTVARICPCSS